MSFNEPLDPVHGVQAVIEADHYQIHKGKFFHVSHDAGTVANSGTFVWHLLTGANTYPHVRNLTIKSDDGPVEIVLREGVTVSDNGTGLTEVNLNRNSSRVSGMTVFHTPTISEAGTQIEFIRIPATGGFLSGATGGVGNEAVTEWILKPSTSYSITATNNAGGNADLALSVMWYDLNA